MLLKRQDIDKMFEAHSRFDKNLQFTVDKFENKTLHFLDLEICPNGLTIFRKGSTLTWTLLLYGNRKQPGSDHLLTEQGEYVQKKTSQKNPN